MKPLLILSVVAAVVAIGLVAATLALSILIYTDNTDTDVDSTTQKTGTTDAFEKAIIISGGYDLTSDQPYKTSVSVEIFVPSTSFQCYLPSLPKSRAFHTHDQWLVCGGRSDSYLDKVDLSCLTLKYGTWSVSHNLTHSRYSHSSWKTDDGVLLLGGSNYISGYTSEIVKEDNVVSELSFSLKFDIDWACSIPDYETDTLVLAGGSSPGKMVSRYGRGGWVEDLPDMLIGRRDHSCSSFVRNNRRVFLVTGGWAYSQGGWSYRTSLRRYDHALSVVPFSVDDCSDQLTTGDTEVSTTTENATTATATTTMEDSTSTHASTTA